MCHGMLVSACLLHHRTGAGQNVIMDSRNEITPHLDARRAVVDSHANMVCNIHATYVPTAGLLCYPTHDCNAFGTVPLHL
jgi:hypothetical protein